MCRRARIHTSRGGEVPSLEIVVPGCRVGYRVIIRSEDSIGDGAGVGFEKRKGASLRSGY